MDREPARSFEDLIVWQKAHAFVLNVYKVSRQFPREETYGLTAQLRRAAGCCVGSREHRGRVQKERPSGSYARTLLSPSS